MKKHRMYRTTEYSFLETLAEAVFLAFFTLICLFSALWMMQDIFLDWQISRLAAVWICGLVVFTCMVCKFVDKAPLRGSLRWICAIMVFGFYGLLFWRYMTERQIDFEDGSCALAVQYLEKLNAYMKCSFRVWQGKRELLGMALAVWMCLAVLALLCLALLLKKRFVLLLLPAGALSALLMIGHTPGWKGTASFFAAVVFAFAGGVSGKNGLLRASAKKLTYGRFRTQLLQLFAFVCLAASGLAAIAVGSILSESQAGRLLEHAPPVKEFQKKVEQEISGAASGFFLRQRENISNQAPHYTGKEVIKMTVSRAPESDVYLRGFYGTDYEDGSWVYREQAFADACGQAGYTQEQAAEELLQAGYDLFFEDRYTKMDNGLWGAAAGIDRNIDYKLEYTDIRSRYAYLPYFTNPLASQEKSSLTGDVLVQKDRNQKEFSAPGWNGGVDLDFMILIQNGQEDERGVFEWYDAFAESAYLAVSDRVPSVSRYLQKVNLQELFEDDIIISSEGNYEVTDTQERLLKAWMVCRLLQDELSYSLDLDPLPDGEEAVEYFLSKSREGFCIHFASAAVFLLRASGIPARYVSGYVARNEDFQESGDHFTVSVKDHDAHAWAEIYLDGIGWAPVDATPGDGRRSAAARAVKQTDTKAEDSRTEDTSPEDTRAEDSRTEDAKAEDTQAADSQAEDEQSKERQEPGGNGRTDDGWESWFPLLRSAVVIVSLLACVLFVYGIIRAGVRSYHNVPKGELKKGRYRKAVLRLNRRIYRKVRLRGRIHKNSMTDAEYEKELQSVYPKISKAEWERYMQVVKAAAFSNEEPECADAYFCWRIYSGIVRS